METSATFRLFGDVRLTSAAVTEHLGITPTTSFEEGDLQYPGRSERRRKASAWLLQTGPGVEEGVELSVQIDRLLALLEPVAPRVWELVDRGYEANWNCFVGSHVMEHAVELDRRLLERLLRLPGDLWIDAYGDGIDSDTGEESPS